MADTSGWPLPSQSWRVRLLLYLTEGLIFGAGVADVILVFLGPFLVDIDTGEFTPDLTLVDGFRFFVLLFFLVRGVAMIGEGRR